jgi:cytochrome P450 family 109
MIERQPSRSSGPTGVRRLQGVAEISRHAELKEAARDWSRFSSDLIGDVDVRDYHQLPLEVDPPAHAAYRAIVAPVFSRRALLDLEPRLAAIAGDLVRAFATRGRAEAVHDLAVPMVGGSIAWAFGRGQDADELASWGLTSWEERPDGSRSSARLDAYVARVLDEGLARPGDDAFSRIAAARIDGRRLTRVEMVGLANLILAGGRDTVIDLLAGAMWALAGRADERRRLGTDPAGLPVAIDELVRWLSPLPRMERRATMSVSGAWGSAGPDDIVILGFARANHDPSVFAAPGELRLDRRPNPHVGFGAGPHTCIGLQLARLEARVFMETLLRDVPDWHLGPGARIMYQALGGARIPTRIDARPIEVGP